MHRNLWHGGNLMAGKEDGFGSRVSPRLSPPSHPDILATECEDMAKPDRANSISRIIPESRGYNSRISGGWGYLMSPCRKVALSAGLMFLAMFANAAVKNKTIHITVLDSETRSVSLKTSDVPKNCDQVNYDAYCLSSKTADVTTTLLVQEGNSPPFHITCTIDSKWSRCIPLPKGESFDARREKRGLVLYYVDDKGKLRNQLYTYVPDDTKGQSPGPAVAGNASTSPAPVQNTGQAAPVAPSPPQVTVKCSFSSTPSGADVTLDGRYVGSTPSVLNLTTGQHVVLISTPSFVAWKRELTVSPGSELTINAVLEKAQ